MNTEPDQFDQPLGVPLHPGPVPPTMPPTMPPTIRAVLRRRWLSALGLVVVVGTIVAVNTVPLQLIELRPGRPIDLQKQLLVDGEAPNVNGDYFGLTVSYRDATPVDWAQSRLGFDENELVDRDVIYPPVVDRSDYNDAQRQVFLDATDVAAYVAQRALGLDAFVSGKGVRVMRVSEGAPAEGILAVGDVIVEANGVTVRIAEDLIGALEDLEVGDVLALTVERPAATSADTSADTGTTEEPTRVDVEIRLGSVEGLDRPGIGINLEPVDTVLELPVPIEIDQNGVGGPSAGLLTALVIYDDLSEVDVARGRRIAGTGTLSLDGSVGRIGGINEKARSAVKAKADIFFVPLSQVDEVRAVIGDAIPIVGVDTFGQAVDALLAPDPAPSADTRAAGS